MTCKEIAPEKSGAILLFPFVFFSGGQATPYMAFLLVSVQNVPYLGKKAVVKPWQPLCQILMYGGFGYPEACRCCADSGSGFNDVHSQLAGAFFDVVFHIIPSDAVSCQKNLCRIGGNYAS